MGKQNIVAGGFYGKVGQLIGQRWKNIRTVRSYVKPRNPRTEKQQANRKTFGSYIPLCQLAMQLNYKAPYFRSESNSEWGLRMSLASALLKSGYELLNLIPIIPMNYTPAYIISEITAIDTSDKKRPKIYVRGTLPDKNRIISVVIAFYDEKSESYNNQMYNATLQSGENPFFEVELQTSKEIDKSTRFIIVSNDDAEQTIPAGLENVTIASKMMSYDVVQPIIMENLNYEKSLLNSAFLSFVASVSSLSKLGISDNKTLSEVYTTAGVSHANCRFGLYDAENENPAVLSADTSISSIEYVSDTSIKVTLKLDAEIDITQSIKEIVEIAENAIFIKSIDTTKPVIYMPAVTNQALPYETFTKPSTIKTSGNVYNVAEAGNPQFSFTTNVSSLAKYGITNTATLLAVWDPGNSSSANGTYSVYNGDTEEARSVTASSSIIDMAYVSDTKVSVTVELATSISETEYVNGITSIADGAIGITNNNIRYPNFAISEIKDAEIDF